MCPRTHAVLSNGEPSTISTDCGGLSQKTGRKGLQDRPSLEAISVNCSTKGLGGKPEDARHYTLKKNTPLLAEQVVAGGNTCYKAGKARAKSLGKQGDTKRPQGLL